MKKQIFLGLVGAMAAYELVMLEEHDTPDTISGIMWAAAARRPLVPFALGMLMGHFFWQAAPSEPTSKAA